MAAKTTYLANLILDAVLGNPSFPPSLGSNGSGATLYLALFTTAPAADGSGTEASGTSYARSAVSQSPTNWPTATTGSKSNGTAVNFGTAGGSWGTVTHFAAFDALTGGNMLYFGPLTQPMAVTTGDVVTFPAGAIVVNET